VRIINTNKSERSFARNSGAAVAARTGRGATGAVYGAAETEAAAEADWLWKGKHAKLIDGFTFTMPDTAKNQAEYPQQKSQKPGVGLPIARVVAILSLATACVMDAALGPYAGKQTGEPGKSASS
jgi:hypothetical protein